MSPSDDDVNVLPQKFSRDFADTPGPSLSPAILDCDILSHNPAEIPQAGDEGSHPRFPDRRIRAKDSDTPWLIYLLRIGGKRPRGKTATKTSDEFPPLHMSFPPLPRAHSGRITIMRFSGLGLLPRSHTRTVAHPRLPNLRMLQWLRGVRQKPSAFRFH